MSKPNIPKKRACFYASGSTLAEFKQTCKREGTNMSVKIEQFLTQYVQAHSVGNPQLRISVYAKPEEQQPMRVLCRSCNGAVSDGRVFCGQADMWVPGVRCYSCDKNMLRKKK
jgi:ribosomal protein L44E